MFAATPYLGTITVQVDNPDLIDDIQTKINATLKARHSLGSDDDAPFSVTNFAALVDTLATVQATLSLLLGGIASISLIVGGIGGWAFTLSLQTFALALGFSALVGIVFGTWPAQIAARLQPVDALGFE